jgi:hypothetical protein
LWTGSIQKRVEFDVGFMTVGNKSLGGAVGQKNGLGTDGSSGSRKYGEL